MDLIEYQNQLADLYRPDTLRDAYQDLLKDYLDRRPDVIRRWGIDARDLRKAFIRQEMLTRVFASLFLDEEQLTEWLNQLPDDIQKATLCCVWKREVSADSIKRDCGVDAFSTVGDSSGRQHYRLNPGFRLFQLKRYESYWSDSLQEPYIQLPEIVRACFRYLLPFPSSADLTGLEKPPPATFVFEDAERILEKLPAILEYIDGGMLAQTKTGGIARSSLRRLVDIYGIKEFFTGKIPPQYRLIRTEILTHMIFLRHENLTSGDPYEILKEFFSKVDRAETIPVIPLLNHLNGWRHTNAGQKEGIHYNILESFRLLPDDRWIMPSTLSSHIEARGIDVWPLSPEEADRYLYFTENWPGWGNKKNRVIRQRYEPLVVDALIDLYVYIAASFGLIDLKYGPPAVRTGDNDLPQCQNRFNTVVAFRKNRLGAYIWNQSKNYVKSAVSSKKTNLILDDQRLHLTVLSEKQQIPYIIDQVAEKVSSRLYKVTLDSVLKNCRTAEELRRIIYLFEKELPSELPAIWRELLYEVKSRFIPLLPVETMTVFRLPDNSSLLRLVTRDPVIRQLVIRAEGRYVIVKKQDLERLKSRLGDLGYIL